MSEPTLAMVVERLTHLEQQLRWWKGLGVLVAVVLGLLVLMGATRGGDAGVVEEVKARRFVLVDQRGVTRRRLLVEEESGYEVAMLEMLEPKNAASTVIAVSAVGAFLTLTSKDGNAGVMLGVPQILGLPKPPSIEIYPLVQLQLNHAKPSLRLADGTGRIRAVLGHNKLEHRQPLTGAVQVQERPISSLTLTDELGKVLWSAP
jgi:hypothetical protein